MLSHNFLKIHFLKLEHEYENLFILLLKSFNTLNIIIMPFLGGIFILKFGLRIMYLNLGLTIFLGQIICFLGILIESIYLFILGRIIVELVGECFIITKISMISKWFFKSELGFPIGTMISFSNLGNIMAFIVSKILNENNKKVTPFIWIGILLSIICLLITSTIIYLDKCLDKNEKFCQNPYEIESVTKNKIMKNINDLDDLFWINSIICMIFYSIFKTVKISTQNSNKGDLVSKDYNIQNSNLIELNMNIPFLLSTMLNPLAGCISDISNLRLKLMMISCVLLFISYLLFLVSNPMIGLMLLGNGYSLFSISNWSVILFSLEDYKIGLASGIKISLQNFGYSIFYFSCGVLFSKKNSHFHNYLNVALSLIALLLTKGIYSSGQKSGEGSSSLSKLKNKIQEDEELD